MSASLPAPASRPLEDAADDGDALPRRVLLLGGERVLSDLLNPPPHWIVASVHQPGRDSLVRTAQEQAVEAFVLLAEADQVDGWLDAIEAAGEAFRTSPAVDAPGALVKACQRGADAVRLEPAHRAAAQLVVEHERGRQATHLHQPLHGLTRAAQRWRASRIRVANDNAPIESATKPNNTSE